MGQVTGEKTLKEKVEMCRLKTGTTTFTLAAIVYRIAGLLREAKFLLPTPNRLS